MSDKRFCPCCHDEVIVVNEDSFKYCRCGRCGHIQRLQAEKSENYYESLRGRNMVSPRYYSQKIEERLRYVQQYARDGHRIIEIGCAEGGFGARLKAVLDVHYSGIELSDDAIEAEKVLDKTTRVPATAFFDSPHNILLAFHVLEHIQDIVSEVAAWHRLVTKDGLVVVETPNRAGHRYLNFDRNPEHIHQFTCASLSMLMQRSGFEVEALSTGNFESPLYSDSIRVSARPSISPEEKRLRILQKFKSICRKPFAVFGAGGDFKNYVYPYLNELDVIDILDSDMGLYGTYINSFEVRPFSMARHHDVPILIASYRYESEIKSNLVKLGANSSLVFGLSAIYRN